MFNPVNLNATFGLARIQEEYMISSRSVASTWGDKGSTSTFIGSQEGSSGEAYNRVNKPTVPTKKKYSRQVDEKREENIVLPLRGEVEPLSCT